ncbi:uncharacterized protein RCC_03394 [Ramularia collo-cygni]|uniref:Uncharacterized protein n=1 Tax=Ramularia collo-cygni TaxID=112498 RepID=A0A2D3UWP3_9PEZI|nr:uncharacterized protein RCC_03394 [Ramularia collo-cygni]CZT17560.1 uncharacterized protein RCC_03394 [Ramularia collo-cygni]
MAITKTIMGLALLAISVHAQNPVCLDSGRGGSAYNKAQTIQVPDGRVLSFCYNSGSGATIDQNWVTDIDAMLQRRVDGGACCIDCLPTAEENGCTGKSKIWNIDNCDIGDKPTGLDQYSKDVFMDLIKGLADEGRTIAALENNLVTLTIDTADHFREQEFTINGDGDTC